MPRGPDKQFDPSQALGTAMRLFWEKGYAATGMAELQQEMGIGRKSLYDTFGNKRQLYIRSLRHYTATVARGTLSELDKPGSPLANVRRLLRRVEKEHSRAGSSGCMLGVGIAQCGADDPELAEIFRLHMRGVEDAYFRAFERAQAVGELDSDTDIRDLARLFMGIHQGLALIGRVQDTPAVPHSIVNAALTALQAV
jgi:TetR/AcrR family transcriptional repressor of nem operon